MEHDTNIDRRDFVKGAVGKVVAAVSMVVVVLALFFAQAGFISGGADVLMSAGLPEIAAILVFYAVAVAVVFFGLKVMGVSESVSVTVIIAVVLVLVAGSGFLTMMRLSSGLVAILIAIGLPIVVVRAKRMNGRLYLVRPWMASTPVLVVLVAAFVFMAVGSMI